MSITSQKSALVLGSSSDIGRAIAHSLAAKGCAIILAARNAEEALIDATDITIRYGVKATGIAFDIVRDDPASFFAQIGGVPEIVVCVVGYMGEQRQSEQDVRALTLVVESNFTGPARFLSLAAEAMQGRRTGTIIGISSVAGERGRMSNYIYGSAKAGFSAFLSGLRNRLAKHCVHVITVKPGFVFTRMTAQLSLPPLLTAQPEEVAQATIKAIETRRNVIYVRPIWWVIMTIIKAIPEAIFKKLSL